MTMRYRQFGQTELRVSEVGVGCSRIGGALSSGGSRKEEIAMLRAAADAGITFFDTSDLYSQGQSEIMLGRALGARRDEVIIATKGGFVVPDQQRRARPDQAATFDRSYGTSQSRPSGAGSAGTTPMPQDFTPAYLSAAVDASLRRLRTDYIDLYQLHSPPRSVVERCDYVDVLERLKDLGKIRHFGLAADGPEDVSGFELDPGVASVQVPFSLLYPQAADQLFPEPGTPKFAIIARSCYAAGFFRDGLDAATLQGMASDWAEILELHRRAAAIGRPLMEAALQFSLAPRAVSVTILGMRTREHLDANLRHYAAAVLTPSELAVLMDGARGAP